MNVPEKVINVKNTANAASDHNLVGISIRVAGVIKISQIFKKRKWSKFNQDTFNREISEVNWDTFYDLNDPNLAWDYLQTNLQRILDNMAPTVKVQPKANYKTWITSETKQSMIERDVARTRAKTTGDEMDKNLYKRLRNKVTKQVRQDRSKYLNDKYQECEKNNNISELYKIAKKQAGWNKTGPPASLLIEGRNITAPLQIAQEQMRYFHEKNVKLLQEVEGGEEINPLEILKMSFKNWKKLGKSVPEFQSQRNLSNKNCQIYKKSQKFKLMGI